MLDVFFAFAAGRRSYTLHGAAVSEALVKTCFYAVIATLVVALTR